VSAGADSVALLRVLLELRAELGVVLAVAHFNHGLRGNESAADEAFVAELTREHKLDFFAGRGDVRSHAGSAKLSIEAAGRELRYRWLTRLAQEQRFNAIATAHTLDDQAETVLLKFLRGAGTRGLAGIYPAVDFATHQAKPDLRVVRPLLWVSRAEVESYLTSLGQPWREDASNLDRRFTRNRVRHELLPLLERGFNPNIRQVLSDAAEVWRGEEEYWEEQVERELATRTDGAEQNHESDETMVSRPTDPARLNLQGFADLPIALQRRILKRFVEREEIPLDFEHIEKLRRGGLGELPKVELPGEWIAVRVRNSILELRAPSLPREFAGYEYRLTIPGEIEVAELGLTLRGVTVAEQFAREMPSGSLLDAELIGTELRVRNWRPGDRFWPARSRSEEKLKRLFAEKRIPAEQRPSWLVALCGEEIVWVKAFPVARAYQWRGNADAVSIETRP
jgi:tRNA(Ile)-lysidine synthase